MGLSIPLVPEFPQCARAVSSPDAFAATLKRKQGANLLRFKNLQGHNGRACLASSGDDERAAALSMLK